MGEYLPNRKGFSPRAEKTTLIRRSILKPKISVITGDRYLPGGFLAVCREALTRLGIAWHVSDAELEYNLGKTQQVPANPPTKLKTRFRHKLSYRGIEMRFE